jgi:hypothetical protein
MSIQQTPVSLRQPRMCISLANSGIIWVNLNCKVGQG